MRPCHVSVRLIGIFSLLLAVVATPNVTNAAPPRASAALPGSQVETRSTPELIEQAFGAGQISDDERLLQLLYAVYEPRSLDLRFQSSVPWEGTGVVAQLQQAQNAIARGHGAGLSSIARAEFTRLLARPQATLCDQNDGLNTVESENFVVNYDIVTGGLTIDDYLQAMESSYQVEVIDYGWAKPPFSEVNTFQKYPVQIVDLGPSLYGYVTTVEHVGDNPDTPAAEVAASASCMVLNYDMSVFGGDPLKDVSGTVAHEFVHSIQYGYGDPDPSEHAMWYESSAAYMEDEVDDTTMSHMQYLWPEFTSCLGNYPNGAEYSNWLFFRYVAEQNGGTNLANGGEDIMQRTWENIAAGQHGLVAYNNALTWKNPDTGLAKVFHQYAIATRFMKSGPTTSPYHFEEASEYLAYSGTSGTLDNQASLTTLGTSHAGTIDDHYALNWIGLPDQGTYDIVLENTGTGGEFRGSIVADMGAAGVEVTPLPVVAAAGESSVLSSYTVPTGAISVVAVLTNQHQTSDAPATCNANPYQLTVAEHDPGQDSGPVTVFLPYVRR